jgi:hypothetical protein
MSKILHRLLRWLLAACLSLFAVLTMAVPKAAEDAEAAVTFGEAPAPPKPAARSASQPVAKAPKPLAASAAKKPQAHPGKQAVAVAPTTAAKGSRSATAPVAKASTPRKAPEKAKQGSPRKK